MIAVSDFLTEVRALVGTPYGHRGRLPGAEGRMDCVGVPIVALRRCGIDVPEPPPYGEVMPAGLIEGLQLYCDEVPRELAQLGDIVVMLWGDQPCHVGVLIDRRRDGVFWMVRAHAHAGFVRCAPLTIDVRVHSCWRIRGVS